MKLQEKNDSQALWQSMPISAKIEHVEMGF